MRSTPYQAQFARGAGKPQRTLADVIADNEWFFGKPVTFREIPYAGEAPPTVEDYKRSLVITADELGLPPRRRCVDCGQPMGSAWRCDSKGLHHPYCPIPIPEMEPFLWVVESKLTASKAWYVGYPTTAPSRWWRMFTHDLHRAMRFDSEVAAQTVAEKIMDCVVVPYGWRQA